MNKLKITAFLLLLITIITNLNPLICFADGIKLKYQMSIDFPASAPGENTLPHNGWYFQYSDTKELEGYKDLTWAPANPLSTNWYVYGNLNENKYATNYIDRSTIQASTSAPSAALWIAPFSGTVNLKSAINLKKNTDKGYDVYAKIIKASGDYKEKEIIWSKTIEGKDNVGEGNNYDIDVFVKALDRIYFEISTENATYGETKWDPVVEYIQGAVFSVGENEIVSTKAVAENDTVKCMLYDKESINDEAKAYLAVYDSRGALRKLQGPESFELTASERYKTISVEMNLGESSYENWKISLFVLTGESGRLYPMDVSEVLYIK